MSKSYTLDEYNSARTVVGDAITELGAKDDRVWLLTPDIGWGCKDFKEQNPDRFIDTGIAEQDVVGVASGLAYDGNIPFIIIMDRGYPSTPAFIHMMDKDLKFIVRLKSSDYKKEQSSLTENDQLVKIKLDKSRIRHYEGTPDGERMKELGEISLRMVKILLENGNLEVLATNLSQTEFHTEEIKELYHMRWGIMQISA